MGTSQGALASSLLEMAASGFTEFVTRQMVMALIKQRREMKAENKIALRDMATRAVDSAHLRAQIEENRGDGWQSSRV